MLVEDQKVELDGIGGVLVYRDATVPALFHYCATQPAIARDADGDGFQLTLVHYDKPTADAAGMLSFVVSLEPEPDALQAMQAQLRDKVPDAQFRPMPWTSGEVTAAIAGGTPVTATPSLLGENTAVLCVPLALDQYLILKHWQGQGALPVSVVYSLSYEAFRNSYEFKVEFDQTRFREWVQHKCSAGFLFISLEKVEVFSDLTDSGVIRVTSLNQTGETPPEGFRRAFLRSLQSLLTPLPRFATPPDGGEDAWLIGFDCSTVRDIQSIGQRLDSNMQIAGAVTRKLYLQGTLDRFAEAMASQKEIELPTSMRFTQRLAVRCQSAFDTPLLDAVQVNIRPQTIPLSSHVFHGGATGEWPVELVHEPGATAGYSCQCNLHFGDAAGNRSRALAAFPIRPGQAYLDIVPEAHFTTRSYRVGGAEDFPWPLLKSVTLTLHGPDGLTFNPPTLLLRPSITTGTITALSLQPVSLDEVFYRAVYEPVDGTRFELQGSPAGAVIFLNPFRRRTVTFQAAADFDWKRYSRISISLDRPDGMPQLWGPRQSRLMLNSASTTLPFQYWFTDDRTLRYRTAFIQNGQATPGRNGETRNSVISISDRE